MIRGEVGDVEPVKNCHHRLEAVLEGLQVAQGVLRHGSAAITIGRKQVRQSTDEIAYGQGTLWRRRNIILLIAVERPGKQAGDGAADFTTNGIGIILIKSGEGGQGLLDGGSMILELAG